MGIVYAAEQEQPIRRRVALKVIKPGMDSKEIIGRFSAERQALALMDHPNIAKVLDAGTTDSGRPYFVMEFVRGLPITEYCDRAKLSLRERLKLFITVCHAIQHAHQKGIIHRDLKPSNVMITLHDGTPVPKVIDFGVAKALNQRLTEQTVYTRAASLVGTPMYMSPEQAELSGLDVDTRSDVYALGTLLYELLTGHTPFDRERLSKAGYDELRRIIREDEPPRPSQRINTLTAADSTTVSTQRGIDARKLQSTLHGELDWIVMKALEKDRNRRYESASAFAADVERYISGEAVQACPPSAGYRLRKFVRRNSVALVTTAVVAIALLAGTGVSVWQAMEARSARKLADDRLTLADENFQTALDAVEQMTRVAEDDLAPIRDVEPVRKKLLEQALQFYEKFLTQRADDPQMQFEVAKAWHRVGSIKGLMSDPGSPSAFVKAVELVEELRRDKPDDIRYLELLAEGYAKIGPFDQARSVCEKLQQLAPDKIEHRRIWAEILYLSFGTESMLGAQGKTAEQYIENLQEAIRIQREILTTSHDKARDSARLMNCLDWLAAMIARNDIDQAERLLNEAVSMGEAFSAAERDVAPTGGHDDPAVALASALIFRGKIWSDHQRKTFAEQNASLRRGYAMLNAHYALHPPQSWGRHEWSIYTKWYCDVLTTAGHTEEAERLLRDACEIHLECDARVFDDMEQFLSRLALLLDRKGRSDDEGLASIRRRFVARLEQQIQASEINESELPRVRRLQAVLHFDLGHFDESVAVLANASKEAPSDLSILFWIPPAAVAACPDENFRAGVLRLAGKMIQSTNGSVGAYTARARLHQAMGNLSAAQRDIESAFSALSNADEDRSKAALACNNLAWQLATDAQIELRDPKYALLLAEKAIAIESSKPYIWNTLGVARYRNGDWTGALKALEKSSELAGENNDHASFDWFFMAMCCRQLDRRAEADEWYEKAVAWMEQHAPQNYELQRIRTETAKLLGIPRPFGEPGDSP